MRPLEGPRRAADAARRRVGAAHGHVAPPEARQGARRPRAQPASPSCFGAPEGYEIALGNGGTTAFWDAAAFGLVRERALALVYGEFSRKFATVTERAPFLAEPLLLQAEPGDAPQPAALPGADVIGWAHNETSTGVMVARAAPGRRRRRARARRRHVRRRRPAARRRAGRRVLLRAAEEPRLRRRPVARAAEPGRDRAHRRDRRRATAGSPSSSRCRSALDNSRKDQTLNTPAIATLVHARRPARMDARAGRPGRGASRARPRPRSCLYGWAEAVSATRRRSSRTPPSARSSSARSTSTTRSTASRSPRRCAPTASSTSSPTASSAATSCASRCSRRSNRTTCRRSPPASTSSSRRWR